MKPSVQHTTKIAFANSESGNIGSRALFSAMANPAARIDASARSAIIAGESHGSVVPPRLVKRMMHPSAPASNAAPR
jgi:hypothetical protein